MSTELPNYDAFVAFAQSQPPEQAIDHDGGWCSCAIGEYIADTSGLEQPEGMYNYSENAEFHAIKDCFLSDMENEAPIVYELLNQSECRTYGELCLAIAAQEISNTHLPF